MTASARRHTIGVIALTMLAAAAVLLLMFDGNVTDMYGSICLRVGMALGAGWLAYPQIQTLAAVCLAIVAKIRPTQTKSGKPMIIHGKSNSR